MSGSAKRVGIERREELVLVAPPCVSASRLGRSSDGVKDRIHRITTRGANHTLVSAWSPLRVGAGKRPSYCLTVVIDS